MIFNVLGHIDMIRNGLHHIESCKPIVIKTQTRRLNRGMYYVGSNYAVQSKRGVNAESDIRIVMDRIWEEEVSKPNIFFLPIIKEDARAEGGYTPEEYEKAFRETYPKWDGGNRWAFEFHVIEVQRI